MSAKLNRSGFTSTGFSRAGFGCCSKWQQCDLGRLECAWATIDTEVKDYCNCYRRNHRKKSEVNQIDNTNSELDKSLFEQVRNEHVKQEEHVEVEQLSLFQ